MIDAAQAVRAGEELDIAEVSRCLEQVGLHGSVEVEQFPRGFSNLTYLLRVAGQELVLRRPPFGSKVKSAHDMEREYRILQALHPRFGRVPKPVAYFPAQQFYVMERVYGVILRDRPPTGAVLDEATMRAVSEACIDTLCDIHAVDCPDLQSLGRGDGYVERQVRGWSDRYLKARTDDMSDMEQTATWLAEHLPASGPSCLVHNDYKYDNLVLDPERLSNIRAVLDWEMATLGDPLMDLGTSLGYWLQHDDPVPLRSLPFALTARPGNLSREQVVQRYAERSGRTVENPAFYYAFGLFKIAVIAQQIYARYRQGLTQDERFAHLLEAIRLVSRQAWRVCQSGKL